MAARRRRGARGGRRSAWNGPAVGGVALGVLAILLIGAMFAFRPQPVVRHPETLCPDAGPSRITAVFVDTTDRVGPNSRDDILMHLDNVVADSVTDEMLVAYESASIDRTPDAGPSQALLTVCNPGDPEEASEWTQNPRLIRQRLEERFRIPLDRLFRQLLTRDQMPTSPLMENIQSISVRVFSRREYRDIPKRLVLVSDLMQNSEHLSLFRHSVDYDAFAGTSGARALTANLRDVRVEILFVERGDHGRIGDTLRLIEFWERWIDAQGGRLEQVRRIQGLN